MRRPMAAAASKMRSVHMSRTEMTHSAAAPAMAATAAPATAATVTATTAAVATAPVTGERAAGRAQSNYDCADAYGQSQCGKVPIKQRMALERMALPSPNVAFP